MITGGGGHDNRGNQAEQTEMDTDTEPDIVGHRYGSASHRHGRADGHGGNTLWHVPGMVSGHRREAA